MSLLQLFFVEIIIIIISYPVGTGGSFPGEVKLPGREVYQFTKECVELYLRSPSTP